MDARERHLRLLTETIEAVNSTLDLKEVLALVATKVAAALKYKMSSGEVVAKAKTDAKLDAEIKADPAIGTARQGAVLIMGGGDILGAFAVSGAPGGDKDEECARAGLDAVRDKIEF